MLPLFLIKQISTLKQQGLLRERGCRQASSCHTVNLNGRSYLNFASNDYLGLANDPLVKQAFKTAVDQYGVGSMASAAICGYTEAHQALEQQTAKMLNREACLLFNSGYHANLALLTSFANRHSLILADKDIHASLIDGALLSRAKLRRFSNMNDLMRIDQQYPDRHKIIASESVFSMDGRLADIQGLSKIKQMTHSLLFIDDAHGFGIINTQQYRDIDLVTIPLGKAAGSMGAIVCGSANMIEILHQSARSYRYSTALPPAICAATCKALELIAKETWRRDKLLDNIKYFIDQSKACNIILSNDGLTPIKSIIIGDNHRTLNTQQKLKQAGIFVSAIRPPTVAKNSSRLRISINCLHSKGDIDYLIAELNRNLGETHHVA